MKNLTLENIANVCGGEYHGPEDKKDTCVTEIVTDSRKASQGCLFVAIPGARVDGHDFIPQVMEAGALCSLSERTLENASYPYIQVKSCLQAVKEIAAFYLKQLQLPVVGITGSVGKTSTKEMIASVLEQKYRVLKTEGNFNNELGLPLTVFRLREEDEIAVLEMGISDFGEMHRLAAIARPDTCVITNIGTCHLENLGDRDGVLQAKTEVFDHLKSDACVILNGDDDKLITVNEVQGRKPVFFGIEETCEIYADQIVSCGLSGSICQIHTTKGTFEVKVPMPGLHMIYNAMAGTAVGIRYGLSLEQIKEGIETVQSLSGRFHIIETDQYTIIDDCYNANPMSMKASIGIMKDALGRKVAILGDMGELGAEEELLHAQVGSFAGESSVDVLLCVGKLSVHIAEAAKKAAEKAGKEMQILHFASLEELLEKIMQLVKKGDTILVKASHYMQFPKVVSKLTE